MIQNHDSKSVDNNSCWDLGVLQRRRRRLGKSSSRSLVEKGGESSLAHLPRMIPNLSCEFIVDQLFKALQTSWKLLFRSTNKLSKDLSNPSWKPPTGVRMQTSPRRSLTLWRHREKGSRRWWISLMLCLIVRTSDTFRSGKNNRIYPLWLISGLLTTL